MNTQENEMDRSYESIFDRIDRLTWMTNAVGRPQRWQPSVESSLPWLRAQNLTANSQSMQLDPSRDPLLVSSGTSAYLGLPTHRAEKKSKDQLKALRERHKGRSSAPATGEMDRLWKEYEDPAGAISQIDMARLPADALAFYRPFHFSPHNEWGIYMLAGPLLNYCLKLYESFKGHLCAFQLETLLGCVLFEVFHHEFFHHLVECAATTMEIASAAFGQPRAIFLRYWNGGYAEQPGLGVHQDHPLEEALANAYAYNSFSFLSRTEIGQKLLWIRLYQKVLEKCWPLEPAGYRRAGKYVNGEYVGGAAQLLAMLLSSDKVDPASLMLLAKRVLPNGNSAFLQKPNVPTYFVGSQVELEKLHRLVPALNETYTSLLWLGNTSSVDRYLKDRRAEPRAVCSRSERGASEIY